ncbi:MAG: type II toxin-antitoxin system RelE/ParE family toxin [Sulfuriferula sp.]|nr:type II toxin-antitoxin system RelE/ParE family toxin [Sulfuriferula sp.]
MYSIIETETFTDWLNALRDGVARNRLVLRLRKASLGNLGDVKPVGDGVFEMRDFFGPGWRMYYVMRSGTMIFMLGGGDKPNQERDIAKAKTLALEIEK